MVIKGKASSLPVVPALSSDPLSPVELLLGFSVSGTSLKKSYMVFLFCTPVSAPLAGTRGSTVCRLTCVPCSTPFHKPAALSQIGGSLCPVFICISAEGSVTRTSSDR